MVKLRTHSVHLEVGCFLSVIHLTMAVRNKNKIVSLEHKIKQFQTINRQCFSSLSRCTSEPFRFIMKR